MFNYSVSKITAIAIVLSLTGIAWVQRDALAELLIRMGGFSGFQRVLNFVHKDTILPEPLSYISSGQMGDLTVQGVIQETNSQRDKKGLPPLRENLQLDKSARLKMQDMFNKQYFEHESPDGKGPSDLADEVGYEYLMVGENLAEGSFQSDLDLVQAWMDSPGHRANILHNKFQEIGVAVGKGKFEGRTVWIAVQSFGVPASVCIHPSNSSQQKISQNNKRISELKNQADVAKQIGDVEEYNNYATQINQLVSETKILVNQYNDSVDVYNSCLEANS